MNLNDMPPLDGMALPQQRLARVRFTAEGGDYFRIWIVNLLLSILTLGIYSAWAKVRRERFFMRNTLLDDSAFDYHGNPLSILKGRALVVVVLVLLNLAEKANPAINLVATLAFLFLLPWMIARALRFRAANTSWRGLRFRFDGSPADAARAFLGWPLLSFLTAGLLYPVALVRQRTYVVNHLRFGGAAFDARIALGSVYGIVLKASLLFVAGLVFATLGGAVVLVRVLQSLEGDPKVTGAIVALAVVLAMFVLVGAVMPYIRIRLANLVWNAASLGEHRFRSDMRVRDYYRLLIGNWLLSVLTLGLYWPFARVRLWRYRVEHFGVKVAGDLDGFLAEQQEVAKVLGEESADLLDVDVGF
ncbi:MAG: DUF898 domain-containing protein [Zoogloea sp.]|nr:DUF898 domain-containing protein [Zoogloea sp.]